MQINFSAGVNLVIDQIENLFVMDKIKQKMNFLKQKLNDFFSMKTSINNLMNFNKNYLILSYGIDDLEDGTKHPVRFKIIILVCILTWIAMFYHLILLVSNRLYHQFDGPFLPDHFRVVISLYTIILLFVSIIRADYLLGELKYGVNGSPFKIFYYLMKNIQSKHKLTQSNYKKLSWISRLIQLIMLDYGSPIAFGLISLIMISITLSSGKLIWLIQTAISIPFYINISVTLTGSCCIVYIWFSYYKFRFDQINQRIINLIPNRKWRILIPSEESKLIELMDEHNKLAIEVDKFNLIKRRIAGMMFVCYAFVKIITLYLIIELKHDFLARMLMSNIFFMIFNFGFGLSYLYSQQIESAHQSYKLIHSIVCKYKMNFPLRIKVILNQTIIFIF